VTAPGNAPGKVGRLLADLGLIAGDAAHLVAGGRERYLEDSADGRLRRNAGERVLIKVATVVERLPDGFKEQYPGVDWVAISRMRNLVAHHYEKVNHDLMWAALAWRIPALIENLGRSQPPPQTQIRQ
jgi:uncharacterized protein with HEPN domain